MRTTILTATFVLAAATPALAHRHGGDDHSQHQQQQQTAISQERAVEIAREQGVATVREVKMDDGAWKVEGTTSEGRRIEVEINPQTGAVVKRELY
jgi:uncharacterized membrane protein YkoI